MKGRRIFLFFAFFIWLKSMVYAQVPVLVVWTTDGSKAAYELSELPKTVFEGGNMVISTSSVTVTYLASEISKYTYEGNFVDNIENAEAVCMRQDGDVYTFENLKDGETVRVFGADGVLLSSKKAQAGAPVAVSLGNLPNGVYVIKTDKKTHKVVKR